MFLMTESSGVILYREVIRTRMMMHGVLGKLLAMLLPMDTAAHSLIIKIPCGHRLFAHRQVRELVLLGVLVQGGPTLIVEVVPDPCRTWLTAGELCPLDGRQ